MTLLRVKSRVATIVAAVLMGSLGFFVREAGTDAAVTTFFRFSIGFLLISLVVLVPAFVHKPLLRFSPASFFSGMAISLCILFYFFAIRNIPIGLAAFTLYLGPVFAIVGEAFLSRRLPSLRQGGIILLAFAGFFLISSLNRTDFAASGTGMLMALLSGVFYGAYILINRIIEAEVAVNVRVFWQFFAAVLTIGSTFLFREPDFSNFAHGWPYLLIIGVVQGFIVLLLTGYAIKHLKAVEFGVLSYIEPLVALMLGFWLYSETLTLAQTAGVVLIVLATVFQCVAGSSDKS